MTDTETAPGHQDTEEPLRRNHGFWLLLGGSSVSMLGSRVTTIAYPLLVLTISGSPVMAGWACFAATAPSVLFYLPAGAIVDRWNPRIAMLTFEALRGLVIAGIVAALVTHKLTVLELIVAAGIEEIFEVFSSLAERRLTYSLVDPGSVPSALAQTEAREHTAVMLGRPLGAFLFGVSHSLPFFVDFLSFEASVASLLRLGKHQRCDSAARPPKARLTREMAQGFGWLLRHPFALVALPLTAGTTFVGQALIMIFLSQAHAYSLTTFAIGISLAASGVGGAVGSLAAPRLLSRYGYPLFRAQLAAWVLTFAFLAIWGWRSFVCIAGAMMFMSFTGAAGNVTLDNYIAENAGETLLARVTSINSLISFAALALGPLCGAVVLRWHGPRFAVIGLLITVGLLCAVAPATPDDGPYRPVVHVTRSLGFRVRAWSHARRSA
jgi:MFS family permease